ncbi:hypothetical protein OQ279_08850 [Salinimicrobium sp. MT39]|uniref:DUF302 domain-containing protein n=2 Tax=Salinimicrobium profundisediminis TaxID=2994553 RepID=A0A9X3CZL2_9FLAO|nr:hypothetical protein [Salinimicrobium profundisediminis]
MGIFMPCSITIKEIDRGIVEVAIEDTAITWTSSNEINQLAKEITNTLKEILSEIEQPGMQL